MSAIWKAILSVLRPRRKLPGKYLLMSRESFPNNGTTWTRVGVFTKAELHDAREDYSGRQVMATGQAMTFHFRQTAARVGDE